jgi:hypothetical protein
MKFQKKISSTNFKGECFVSTTPIGELKWAIFFFFVCSNIFPENRLAKLQNIYILIFQFSQTFCLNF